MNRFNEPPPVALPFLSKRLAAPDQWEFTELVACADCDCEDTSDRLDDYRPASCASAEGIAWKSGPRDWQAKVKGQAETAHGRSKARAIETALYGRVITPGYSRHAEFPERCTRDGFTRRWWQSGPLRTPASGRFSESGRRAGNMTEIPADVRAKAQAMGHTAAPQGYLPDPLQIVNGSWAFVAVGPDSIHRPPIPITRTYNPPPGRKTPHGSRHRRHTGRTGPTCPVNGTHPHHGARLSRPPARHSAGVAIAGIRIAGGGAEGR